MADANVDNSSAIGNITVRDNRTWHIKCFIHPLHTQTSIWETAYRQLLEALQKTLEGDWVSIKFKPAVASCFCYNSSPPIATATSFFSATWASSEHKSNGRFSRWTDENRLKISATELPSKVKFLQNIPKLLQCLLFTHYLVSTNPRSSTARQVFSFTSLLQKLPVGTKSKAMKVGQQKAFFEVLSLKETHHIKVSWQNFHIERGIFLWKDLLWYLTFAGYFYRSFIIISLISVVVNTFR